MGDFGLCIFHRFWNFNGRLESYYKTLGVKMVKLRPMHGFSAEFSSAVVILVASLLGAPLSTTHVISASIMGVGATHRLSVVRWGIAFQILLTWIFTFPGVAFMAIVTYLILRFII